MSRGLGRTERAILDALARRRQLLTDRWHPLLVNPLYSAPRLVAPGSVGQTIVGAISHHVSDVWYKKPLPAAVWDDILDTALEHLDEVHSPPYLGEPLTEFVETMRAAERPRAVEVSVQRAAKRLEDKSLIERIYWTAECGLHGERTFVCVRMTPSADELAETDRLRVQAKEIHSRHTRAAVKWIRERGQTFGYHNAAVDWLQWEELTRDDGKWLNWFDML